MSQAPVATKSSVNLRRAARILDKNGLCRGNLTDRKGRFCAMGAMAAACQILSEYRAAIDIFVSICPDRNIPVWNDHKHRRKRDVVRKLLQAARLAKKKER